MILNRLSPESGQTRRMRQGRQLETHTAPGARNEGPPRLLFDRRRQPRKLAMLLTTVRLHDYDLSGFAAVAAEFGSEKLAYVVNGNRVSMVMHQLGKDRDRTYVRGLQTRDRSRTR
jgi:hypothetical protein